MEEYKEFYNGKKVLVTGGLGLSAQTSPKPLLSLGLK